MIGPRGMIFDWDNTLVDSWACIQAAMNTTLEAMGHAPWNMDEMKSRVALSLRDSFPALFGDRWTEAREIFYATFRSIHIDYLAPLPGIPEMLEELAGLGVRLAVVSNKNGGFLREEARHLGWDKLFDRLVGATDASQDKPAAAPALLAMEAMDCRPGADVWFVGDAAVDMECAANSGCMPILLRAEVPRPGEFDGQPVRCHVVHGSALLDLVRELLVPICPD